MNDKKTAEIAKQLKDLHIVSARNAVKKAEELVKKAVSGKKDSVDSIFKQVIGSIRAETEEELCRLAKLKSDLKEIKKLAVREAQEHVLEKQHFKRIKKNAKELKKDVEDVEDITEAAEKVQGKE